MYLYLDNNFNAATLGSPRSLLRRVRGFAPAFAGMGRITSAAVVYDASPKSLGRPTSASVLIEPSPKLRGMGRYARTPRIASGMGFTLPGPDPGVNILSNIDPNLVPPNITVPLDLSLLPSLIGPPVIPQYTGPTSGSAAATQAAATQAALQKALAAGASGGAGANISQLLGKEIIPGSGISTGLALGGVAALALIASLKGKR